MQFGTFSIWTALIATVASVACYLLSGMQRDVTAQGRLTRAGRTLFFLAAAGILGAAATLGTLLVTHRFDVAYVFFHSARAMAPLYWFPAFWAGQEGSFLLWAFWISVLGIALALSSKGVERRVMPVYSVTLLFLLSLLVIRSPFLPLDTQGLPTPTEGMGLNPNLENYWMAIHPPVMFLGFASLSAVFAFAAAALFWKDDNWLRRALPWGLFGFAVLALAMMMGGRWAYEMLGWGGFWGWDPVEVGPFIPWLGLVGFLHAAQVQKIRGGLQKTTLFFAMLPFVTAMYESFLTRTGVLDKFSVHSFSTLGGLANNVLLGGLLASVFVSIGLLAWRGTSRSIGNGASEARLAPSELGDEASPAAQRHTPHREGGAAQRHTPHREGSILDAPTSREFGFLSAVVLITLSAVITLVGLSSPLLTTLGMKLHLATHVATVKEDFYNRAMFPLGVLLAIGLGVGPHLAWRGKGNPNSRALLTAYGASAVAAVGFFLLTQGLHVRIARGLLVPELLLWTACAFAIVSNVLLLARREPRAVNSESGPRLRPAHVWTIGGTLAHIGAAVLLVGVVCLVTFTKKDPDVVLVQNEPKQVLGGQYAMVYKGQSGNYQTDKDNALLFDVASRNGKEHFTARLPFALRATEGGDKKLFGHPAIASRLSGDLYVALKDGPDEFYPRGRYVEPLKLGQTQTFGPYTVQFDRFERDPQAAALAMSGQMPDVFPVWAVLNVTFHGKTTTLKPQYIIRKDMPGQPQSPELALPGGWKIAFAGMNAGSADAANANAGADAEKGSFVLRPDGPALEAFQLEITTRPAVNLIWLGTLLLVGGGFLSMGRRVRELRASPIVEPGMYDNEDFRKSPSPSRAGGPSAASTRGGGRSRAKRGRVSVSQKPASSLAVGRKGR